MTEVWHNIILEGLVDMCVCVYVEIVDTWTPNSCKIVQCTSNWITITNMHYKVYLAYLFLNCWIFKKWI